jgi:hypothetical protein
VVSLAELEEARGDKAAAAAHWRSALDQVTTDAAVFGDSSADPLPLTEAGLPDIARHVIDTHVEPPVLELHMSVLVFKV